MQTENRLFDDFARLASGAANVLSGVKAEIETMVRQQFEHFVGSLKLVTREEFEVVQALAMKARDEQETLAARLAVLEASLAASAKPKATRKAATPRAS